MVYAYGDRRPVQVTDVDLYHMELTRRCMWLTGRAWVSHEITANINPYWKARKVEITDDGARFELYNLVERGNAMDSHWVNTEGQVSLDGPW